MAFIDSHTFDGFDAADGVTYFPGKVVFASPEKTEAFRRHLASGGAERTFTGMKWLRSPGPTHRFECTVCVDHSGDEAATVAALEAAVAALRRAVAPGATWAFTPAHGSSSQTTVRNVDADAGEYSPDAAGRWSCPVVLLIETEPGWRGASVVTEATIASDSGHIDIIDVGGDMDADTTVRAIPATVSEMVALGLRSGADYDATINEAFDHEPSITPASFWNTIASTDALDADAHRGRWSVFGDVKSSVTGTRYKSRSSVTIADPADSASVDAVGHAVESLWSADYRRLLVGDSAIPCQDIAGLAAGSGYGARAVLAAVTTGATRTFADASLLISGRAQREITIGQTFQVSARNNDAELSLWMSASVAPIAISWVVYHWSDGVGSSISGALPGSAMPIGTTPGKLTIPLPRAIVGAAEVQVHAWWQVPVTVYAKRDASAPYADGVGLVMLGRGPYQTGDGIDSTVDFAFEYKAAPRLVFGATIGVRALNAVGGTVSLRRIIGVPSDEALVVAMNAFSAGSGVLVDATASGQKVLLASATGVGASLAYRSATVGSESVGTIRVRPGNNRVHVLAQRGVTSIAVRVEHRPVHKLPPGV